SNHEWNSLLRNQETNNGVSLRPDLPASGQVGVVAGRTVPARRAADERHAPVPASAPGPAPPWRRLSAGPGPCPPGAPGRGRQVAGGAPIGVGHTGRC
ncbi:hypothetical protein HMPREF9062_1111, partial [Actinomyces sp. oral taxon 448 str. F0400]